MRKYWNVFGGFILGSFLEPWIACLKFEGEGVVCSGVFLVWIDFLNTKVERVVFWVDKETCSSFLDDDHWK